MRMQKELALFRFLGASKLYIASLIILEAVLIGLLHGILAWFSAEAMLAYMNLHVLNWFPFLPVQEGEILFNLPENLFSKILLVSAFSASLAALLPAILASRQSILETLRK